MGPRVRSFACVSLAALSACAETPSRAAAVTGSPAPPELVLPETRPAPEDPVEPAPSWRTVLADRVATFGYRNVIAVVDSAYPAQTPPGIETIATRASYDEVLAAVLEQLRSSRRVRPRALVIGEIELVPESDAPGIDAFRARRAASLAGVPVEAVSHDDLLERLGRASANYRVLILKTDLELPYSSVFLQLERGYWSDEAEKRLREAPPSPPRAAGSRTN